MWYHAFIHVSISVATQQQQFQYLWGYISYLDVIPATVLVRLQIEVLPCEHDSDSLRLPYGVGAVNITRVRRRIVWWHNECRISCVITTMSIFSEPWNIGSIIYIYIYIYIHVNSKVIDDKLSNNFMNPNEGLQIVPYLIVLGILHIYNCKMRW